MCGRTKSTPISTTTQRNISKALQTKNDHALPAEAPQPRRPSRRPARQCPSEQRNQPVAPGDPQLADDPRGRRLCGAGDRGGPGTALLRRLGDPPRRRPFRPSAPPLTPPPPAHPGLGRDPNRRRALERLPGDGRRHPCPSRACQVGFRCGRSRPQARRGPLQDQARGRRGREAPHRGGPGAAVLLYGRRPRCPGRPLGHAPGMQVAASGVQHQRYHVVQGRGHAQRHHGRRAAPGRLVRGGSRGRRPAQAVPAVRVRDGRHPAGRSRRASAATTRTLTPPPEKRPSSTTARSAASATCCSPTARGS